jgi:hypothetical protein
MQKLAIEEQKNQEDGDDAMDIDPPEADSSKDIPAVEDDATAMEVDGDDKPANPPVKWDRPTTTTARLVERLLAPTTLDLVAKNWRLMKDYAVLLKGIAEMGEEERVLMHEHNALAKLVDLYLGDASPLKEYETCVRLDIDSKFAFHSDLPH